MRTKTLVLPTAWRALALMKVFLTGPLKKCQAGAIMRVPTGHSSPVADESWGTVASSCRDTQCLHKAGLTQLCLLEEKAPLSVLSCQLALPAQPPPRKGLVNL